VLGQEYGNYHAPEPRRALSAPTDLGFNVRAFQGREGRLAELAALDAAWRTLIMARRNAEDPWAHWADEPDADLAPAAWPRRTHDGQRMRDTETADVREEVL
jgi:hypothetical protein